MPLPPPPPACIVIGDSIAVGTAGALASEGLRCEVHARVGASSGEMLRTFNNSAPRERAVIALGSNDVGNPNLLRNLVALRQRRLVHWLQRSHRRRRFVPAAQRRR